MTYTFPIEEDSSTSTQTEHSLLDPLQDAVSKPKETFDEIQPRHEASNADESTSHGPKPEHSAADLDPQDSSQREIFQSALSKREAAAPAIPPMRSGKKIGSFVESSISLSSTTALIILIISLRMQAYARESLVSVSSLESIYVASPSAISHGEDMLLQGMLNSDGEYERSLCRFSASCCLNWLPS